MSEANTSADKSPFFVVGMGRSGSTFLYKMLDEHPEVALTNESHVFDFVYFVYRTASLTHGESEACSDVFGIDRLQGTMGAPWNLQFCGIFVEQVPAMIERFYAQAFPGRAFRRFGDKLPSIHTAVEYRRVDPRTQMIGLIRDPRDVAVSVRKVEWAQSLEECCDLWCTIYDKLVQVPDLHWVRYESLVEAPEECMREVFGYLGLDPELRGTGDSQQEELFASHGTSRSPKASIGRWRDELSAEEAGIVEARCGELMGRFGYA